MKKLACILLSIVLSGIAFSSFFDQIKSEIKLKEEEKPIFENVVINFDGSTDQEIKLPGKHQETFNLKSSKGFYSDLVGKVQLLTTQEKIVPGRYTIDLFEFEYPTGLYEKAKFLEAFSRMLDDVKFENKKYSILLPKEFYDDMMLVEKGNMMRSENLITEPASSLTETEAMYLRDLTKEIKVAEYRDTDQERLNRQVYVLYVLLGKKGFLESNVYTELDKENLIEELSTTRGTLIAKFRNTPVEYFLKEEYKNINLRDFSDESIYKYEKDIILSTKIEDQALFPDVFLHIYINDFDNSLIKDVASKKIKLKRRLLIVENDIYHGYSYNDENTVLFVNGKDEFYYFPDYKIDINVKKININEIRKYNSKYKIGDFFILTYR